MKHHKCFVVLACLSLFAVTAARLSSQSPALVVERQGERLRLSAPGFHFLDGKPLAQLHDGAAVTYIVSVSTRPEHGGARSIRRDHRFVFSYDLWEEKFSVVQVGTPRRSASHLSRDAAEAWCLDAVSPSVADVPADKTFVVTLDCSVPDQAPEQAREGLTLSALLDAFSRKAAAAQPHWEASSPPSRLADLKEKGRH
ncbi:MAG: hypothetical protein ACM3NQ_17225 [Bacteroidales bacterium]